MLYDSEQRIAQCTVVRGDGPVRDGVPVLDAQPGVHARGLRRPPRDRHRDHLVGTGTVHLHRVAESVKRGVWQAGGFPLEFPAMALGETLLRPTAMLYRNLLAMEAEEL